MRSEEIICELARTGDGRITIAARGPRPLGVLIADVRSLETAKIESIVVGPEHQKKGVATRLVQHFEHVARDLGAERLEAMYDRLRPTGPTLDRIFDRAGWHRPISTMYLCRGSVKIGQAPVLATRPPKDAELLLWDAVSEAEKKELLETHAASPWIPDMLSPFTDEPYEPVNSLAARRNGRIVGWMITHRVEPEAIRYSRLFVQEGERSGALGAALLAESIQRHIRSGIPYGTLGVRSDNAPMVRLLFRRIRPYLDQIQETTWVIKRLR